jgi:uncharacterized protein (UPF0332 family)
MVLSKQTLKSAELTLESKDLVWSTSMVYYAEYYALYSFLAMIGIKCENHDCSIEIARFLLDKKIDLNDVKRAKDLRIDAQYYLKTKSDAELHEELDKAKIIVNNIINLINKLTDDAINGYREKISDIIKK